MALIAAVVVVLVLVLRGGDDPLSVGSGAPGYPAAGPRAGDADFVRAAAETWRDSERPPEGTDIDVLWAGGDRVVLYDEAGLDLATVRGGAVRSVTPFHPDADAFGRLADGLLVPATAAHGYERVTEAGVAPVRTDDRLIAVDPKRPGLVVATDEAYVQGLDGLQLAMILLPPEATGRSQLYAVHAEAKALRRALTSPESSAVTLAALRAAAYGNRPAFYGRQVMLSGRSHHGVAVLIDAGRSFRPAMGFAWRDAAGAIRSKVIGTARDGSHPPARLFAERVPGVGLVVAGDARVRRITVDAGPRPHRIAGRFAVLPGVEGYATVTAVTVDGRRVDKQVP